ncbi:hypothetical protein ACROYT_G043356 [Oculina patagonica]
MKCFVAIGMLVCAVVLTDAFNPVGVALKGDNGKYLGRVQWNGINYIEVAKDGPGHFTRFLATESNGKLLLQADNGKYLSRVRWNGIDYIEAAKDVPDVFCHFSVHNQPDGTVVLQADNGKYMSRVQTNGIDFYQAAKSEIDVFCKLHLEFQL